MNILDKILESLLLTIIVALGCWAIYYWLMVIVCDATFSQLLRFLPSYLLASVGLATYLVRPKAFAPQPVQSSSLAIGLKRQNRGPFVLGAVALLICGLAFVSDWQPLSALYSVGWALLVPTAWFFWQRIDMSFEPQVSHSAAPLWDSALVLGLTVALAIAFFQSGRFGPDDAYYAHVMSSLLAQPELSVLQQDTLLASKAPYMLHPAYIAAAYEVMLAVLAAIFSQDTLNIYLHWAPAMGVSLVTLSAWYFMRAIGLSLPGLATTLALCGILFWTAIKGPAASLALIYVGKALAANVAAPILLALVIRHLETQNIQSFLLLFLAACMTSSWSTTGLILVPATLFIAALCFASFKPRLLLQLAISALPAIALLLFSITVLQEAPAHTDNGTGRLFASGTALGGSSSRLALLLGLLLLPFCYPVIKSVVNTQRLNALCLVAAITVALPFGPEWVAKLSGMNFLSWRLQWAFPSVWVPGIAALLALLAMRHWRQWPLHSALISVFPILWIALLAVNYNGGHVLKGIAPEARAFSEMQLNEARLVRALLPDTGLVAAAHLNEPLPTMPKPLPMINVRHYLDYHRGFMPPEEFQARKQLHQFLAQRPPVTEPLGREMLTLADRLGVRSFVFVSPNFDAKAAELSAKAHSSLALQNLLETALFQCQETQSRISMVCVRTLN